ncbi:MAG: hypothetical protein KAG14_04775, partial [Mycoplasmataceae bacterium]|nr:hypothetical protein [Mycoplasmataceae bacterium]
MRKNENKINKFKLVKWKNKIVSLTIAVGLATTAGIELPLMLALQNKKDMDLEKIQKVIYSKKSAKKSVSYDSLFNKDGSTKAHSKSSKKIAHDNLKRAITRGADSPLIQDVSNANDYEFASKSWVAPYIDAVSSFKPNMTKYSAVQANYANKLNKAYRDVGHKIPSITPISSDIKDKAVKPGHFLPYADYGQFSGKKTKAFINALKDSKYNSVRLGFLSGPSMGYTSESLHPDWKTLPLEGAGTTSKQPIGDLTKALNFNPTNYTPNTAGEDFDIYPAAAGGMNFDSATQVGGKWKYNPTLKESKPKLYNLLNEIRKNGGDYTFSIGGWRHNTFAGSVRMAQKNNPSSQKFDEYYLASMYAYIIKKLDLYSLDFDIEGADLMDHSNTSSGGIFGDVDSSIIPSPEDSKKLRTMRLKALKILKTSKDTRLRNLHVSFTIPVLSTGMTDVGYADVVAAFNNGLIDRVSFMTMDYGTEANYVKMPGMEAFETITAVNSAVDQLKSTNKFLLSKKDLYSKVGTISMFGKNDVANETFFITDAKILLNWAIAHNLGTIGSWLFQMNIEQIFDKGFPLAGDRNTKRISPEDFSKTKSGAGLTEMVSGLHTKMNAFKKIFDRLETKDPISLDEIVVHENFREILKSHGIMNLNDLFKYDGVNSSIDSAYKAKYSPDAIKEIFKDAYDLEFFSDANKDSYVQENLETTELTHEKLLKTNVYYGEELRKPFAQLTDHEKTQSWAAIQIFNSKKLSRREATDGLIFLHDHQWYKWLKPFTAGSPDFNDANTFAPISSGIVNGPAARVYTASDVIPNLNFASSKDLKDLTPAELAQCDPFSLFADAIAFGWKWDAGAVGIFYHNGKWYETGNKDDGKQAFNRYWTFDQHMAKKLFKEVSVTGAPLATPVVKAAHPWKEWNTVHVGGHIKIGEIYLYNGKLYKIGNRGGEWNWDDIKPDSTRYDYPGHKDGFFVAMSTTPTQLQTSFDKLAKISDINFNVKSTFLAHNPGSKGSLKKADVFDFVKPTGLSDADFKDINDNGKFIVKVQVPTNKTAGKLTVIIHYKGLTKVIAFKVIFDKTIQARRSEFWATELQETPVEIIAKYTELTVKYISLTQLSHLDSSFFKTPIANIDSLNYHVSYGFILKNDGYHIKLTFTNKNDEFNLKTFVGTQPVKLLRKYLKKSDGLDTETLSPYDKELNPFFELDKVVSDKGFRIISQEYTPPLEGTRIGFVKVKIEFNHKEFVIFKEVKFDSESAETSSTFLLKKTDDHVSENVLNAFITAQFIPQSTKTKLQGIISSPAIEENPDKPSTSDLQPGAASLIGSAQASSEQANQDIQSVIASISDHVDFQTSSEFLSAVAQREFTDGTYGIIITDKKGTYITYQNSIVTADGNIDVMLTISKGTGTPTTKTVHVSVTGINAAKVVAQARLDARSKELVENGQGDPQKYLFAKSDGSSWVADHIHSVDSFVPDMAHADGIIAKYATKLNAAYAARGHVFSHITPINDNNPQEQIVKEGHFLPYMDYGQFFGENVKLFLEELAAGDYKSVRLGFLSGPSMGFTSEGNHPDWRTEPMTDSGSDNPIGDLAKQLNFDPTTYMPMSGAGDFDIFPASSGGMNFDFATELLGTWAGGHPIHHNLLDKIRQQGGDYTFSIGGWRNHSFAGSVQMAHKLNPKNNKFDEYYLA